jgi:hypothetical protein
LTRRSLPSKCHTVSRCTSKCNSISAHNKSTADCHEARKGSTALCADLLYPLSTKSGSNVERMARKSLNSPPNKVWLSLRL